MTSSIDVACIPDVDIALLNHHARGQNLFRSIFRVEPDECFVFPKLKRAIRRLGVRLGSRVGMFDGMTCAEHDVPVRLQQTDKFIVFVKGLQQVSFLFEEYEAFFMWQDEEISCF